MKNKNIDVEMLRHPVFIKAIDKKATNIYSIFGKVIDEKFNGDINKFLKFYKAFRQYSARAHKHKDLNEREQKTYAIMKKFFRSVFTLGTCTFAIRIEGKVKKVSFDTISFVLRNKYGVKIVKHGKNFLTNEHWSNFFLPKLEKVNDIYECYKQLKEHRKI